MLVKSVKDAFGNVLDSSKYQVVYFEDTDNNGLDDGDPLVGGTTSTSESVNGVPGSYPKTSEKNYVAVVYAADEWAKMKEDHKFVKGQSNHWFDENGNPVAGFVWSDATTGAGSTDNSGDYAYQDQTFRLSASASEAKSLDGAFAFEIDGDESGAATNSAREDLADTSFKYLGKTINVAFAVNGVGLNKDSDYVVSWSCSRSDIDVKTIGYANNSFVLPAEAATYTATLYGQGDYAGSEETVTITVDPIDLSKDVISVATADSSAGYALPAYTAGGDMFYADYSFVTVNGEPVSSSASLDMIATKFEGVDGVVKAMPHTIANQSGDPSYVAANSKGVYTFKFAPTYIAGGNPNVVGSSVEVEGLVVTDVVKFYYGENEVADKDSLNGKTFYVGAKEAFDPEELAAYTSYTSSTVNSPAKFIYKVTKDGKEVTSYSEPGTYVVTLDSAVTAGFASAGHKVVTFYVAEPTVTIANAFYQVNGKAIDGTFYYTGEAYDVDVVAYDAKKNVLEEGEDYTVVYKLDGKVVESMVDADVYTIEVYAKGNDKTPAKTTQFEISAAPVKSAAADQAIYAYTEDVIEPTFTGYTKDDLTGLSLALNADNAKITYKKWVDAADADGVKDGEVQDSEFTQTVAADELKAVGTYQATIELPTGFKNFTNQTGYVTAVFQISEKAAFSDVSASAWYAESVYSAADFGYMTGLAGTKLFMPESQITRAEVAQVFANMAGQVKDDSKTYPTKFADVEADAWYAQAIAWASQAGIVGGYEGTDTFGTFDNATREQIATMIYRYAKAQGMDVTVEDEAKALSAYSDADQLTFGKTAMAWCVEQGIFGVDTDALRPADNMSRAEMAATAVRVQPEGPKQDL